MRLNIVLCPFTGEPWGVWVKYFREVEPKHELSDITAEELIEELEVIPQTV
ncbi:MAG: hypothetical protein H6550_16145 [Chitinophagales bacterium]|nr:hypothetical protein [Chitinophagales bacterium]